MNNRPDFLDTYCVCNGVDMNHVNIWVDSSPAEPDVNWGGSYEVTEVELLDGTSIFDKMLPEEVTALEERLYEEECNGAEDYGDYLYDLRKDEG